MNRRDILKYTSYFAGAAVAGPLASALLTGCKRDEAMLEEGYQPGYFNATQYAYIVGLADAMLPKDEYPGAVEVGVPQMIDKMVGDVYSEEDQENFTKGLNRLMEKMDADNPGGFAKLDQKAALVYLQDQDLHYKQGPRGDVDMSGEDVPRETFEPGDGPSARDAYFGLKSMIIGNYFNTPEVAVESGLLEYLPVPGEYIPCGDLQELTGGKAWAI
ncbi:gluconate 2-dehydrogenase subunit 3 family protein [Lewinella sp. 4G2]|uniref:gluconate 2-dehydrogenase subunit 3 family protein n=1 Tax=Lewinella sp. 4G2 TaxID=1803372 RepID=UPI0007B4A7CC|nr:gluconate 2-dehydrogenase subunit 3 family protein [Lewinella sp. 4G2]OAV43526.1 hypothetical protein A3850_003010 [Lewinella sp. 4G2]